MKKSLAMYADIQTILDHALASGGGTFTLANRGDAVRWRQRAYEFRKFYRTHVRTDGEPYDRLSFPRLIDGSCDVVIKVVEAKGIFTPAGGTPVPVKDNPLLEEAKRLRDSLGIDDGEVL